MFGRGHGQHAQGPRRGLGHLSQEGAKRKRDVNLYVLVSATAFRWDLEEPCGGPSRSLTALVKKIITPSTKRSPTPRYAANHSKEMKILIFIVLTALQSASPYVISIDNADGGYQNILVGIHPSVPPDEDLITNIKSLFESASEFLHNATEGRLYFKQVTIAIPSSWPARPNVPRVVSNLFDSSHIRIDHPNPNYGDDPYTLQQRGCGEPGEFIHLTPEFVKHLNTSTIDRYGNTAYRLVHEWAHFRYGVFDEYGEPGSDVYPVLYCESGVVRANICSRSIKFYPATRDGKPCRMYRGCKFSTDCLPHIVPDQDVESSIMFLPHTSGVTKFCTRNGRRQHNAFAPNKQNGLCDRKPTWEVISQNRDFKYLGPPNLQKRRTVTFREIQQDAEKSARVVLVLDVSESMELRSRMVYLKRSATHFLREVIPDGFEVAIVSFSTDAKVEQDLIPVNPENRNLLVGVIDRLNPLGHTAIGRGLRLALKVLKSDNHTDEGGLMILMTDGEENKTPSVKEVLPFLVEEKVRVHAQAFGEEADKRLEPLAAATGGKVFSFKDNQRNIELAIDSAFEASIIDQVDKVSRAITVTECYHSVTDKTEIPFTIDEDLGNDTTVTVVSGSIEALKITVVAPDGSVCRDCTTDSKDNEQTIITIPAPAALGNWKLIAENVKGGTVDVNVRVLSKIKTHDEEPVLLRAYVNQPTISDPRAARVYAEVTKGTRPVIKANVTAAINRPRDNPDVQVKLYDTGTGADVTADDGIYSGYFTEFSGKGRYAVEVRADADGRALVRKGRPGSGRLASLSQPSASLPGQPKEFFTRGSFQYQDTDVPQSAKDAVTGDPVGQFERFANGGSFQVKKVVHVTSIPPGEIGDLVVTDAAVHENGSYVVTLSWSCPGEQLDAGQASHVELRAGLNLTELFDACFENLQSGVNITDDDVISGHLSLLPAGSHQNITIVLPGTLVTALDGSPVKDVHFVARAWNKYSVSSIAISTATAHFEGWPAETTTAVGVTMPSTTTSATTPVVTTMSTTETSATTPTATTSSPATIQPPTEVSITPPATSTSATTLQLTTETTAEVSTTTTSGTTHHKQPSTASPTEALAAIHPETGAVSPELQDTGDYKTVIAGVSVSLIVVVIVVIVGVVTAPTGFKTAVTTYPNGPNAEGSTVFYRWITNKFYKPRSERPDYLL